MRKIMSHKVAGRLARTVLPGMPLAALVLGFWVSFAMARAGAYLLDLIRTEPYRSAWTRMLAKEHDVPGWIEDFALTGQGVNTPAHLVPVGHRAFSLATLCKPHDCAANMLYVVFAPDGSQAFAKLVRRERRLASSAIPTPRSSRPWTKRSRLPGKIERGRTPCARAPQGGIFELILPMWRHAYSVIPGTDSTQAAASFIFQRRRAIEIERRERSSSDWAPNWLSGRGCSADIAFDCRDFPLATCYRRGRRGRRRVLMRNEESKKPPSTKGRTSSWGRTRRARRPRSPAADGPRSRVAKTAPRKPRPQHPGDRVLYAFGRGRRRRLRLLARGWIERPFFFRRLRTRRTDPPTAPVQMASAEPAASNQPPSRRARRGRARAHERERETRRRRSRPRRWAGRNPWPRSRCARASTARSPRCCFRDGQAVRRGGCAL